MLMYNLNFVLQLGYHDLYDLHDLHHLVTVKTVNKHNHTPKHSVSQNHHNIHAYTFIYIHLTHS